MAPKQVVCLYYHRILEQKDPLCIPPDIFEDQLKNLARAGYESISLAELEQFLSGKDLPAKKPIILSFDDGFVDFYAYAFPLLKKYGFRAVVFLVLRWVNDLNELPSPEQVQKSPVLKRRAGKAISLALQGDKSSFLSWKMIAEMKKTGLVEFGSHSLSHRAGFYSARIKKFLLDKNPRWVYRQIYGDDFKPGFPAFERAGALAIRRFIPDLAKLSRISEFYQENFAGKQISKGHIRAQLFKFGQSLGRLGDFESEDEAKTRIFYELSQSKKIIEEKLNQPCASFCFPFGDWSEMVVELIQKAGYKLAFTTERGIIAKNDHPLLLKRWRVEAVSGWKLVAQLELIKTPFIKNLVSKLSRSRKVMQEL